MKKSIAFVIILGFISSALFADDMKIYIDLFNKGNYQELYEHLVNWEKKEPNNPEVYLGFVNYYLATGTETTTIMNKPIETTLRYNIEKLNLALEYIDKGIKKAPNRLDFLSAKLYVLDIRGPISEQADCIIEFLKHSKKNKNKWLWKDNIKLEDTYDRSRGNNEDYFLSKIQNFFDQCLDIGSEASYECARRVGLEEIKLYPKSILGYSNMADYSTRKDNLKDAEKYLLEGEKIAPNDFVTCYNLGLIYSVTDRKNEAKIKLERALKLAANSQEQNIVRQKLSEL